MERKITLLVLALFIVVMGCTKKNATPDTNVAPANSSTKVDLQKFALMGLDSPFLRIDSANKMIASYLDSKTDPDQLSSLIVDGDALRYYLSNTEIRYVKLMFAHKMSYVNDGNEGEPCGLTGDALTIVIAGYDAANNYIYSPQGAVMDFCTPCPTSCPVNGTAQYDLFPSQL